MLHLETSFTQKKKETHNFLDSLEISQGSTQNNFRFIPKV